MVYHRKKDVKKVSVTEQKTRPETKPETGGGTAETATESPAKTRARPGFRRRGRTAFDRQSRSRLLLSASKAAGVGLLAFLSAKAGFGTAYPFGSALAAGAPDKFLLPSVLGAAAGAVLFTGPVTAVKNVGAALLLFAARTAFSRLGFRRGAALRNPLTVFFAVLLAAGATGFWTPVTPTVLLTFVGEALLTGVLSVFYRRAFLAMAGGTKPLLSSPPDNISVWLTFGVALASVSGVRLFGADLAFFTAELLLPVFAFVSGPYAAGAAGVTLGLILGFRAETGYLAFSLPLTGFLVSAVAGYGRAPAAATAATVQLIFLFLKGENAPFFASAAVILFSSSVLLFLPEPWLRALVAFLRPLTAENTGEDANRRLSLTLKNTAWAATDVSDAVRKVVSFEEPEKTETQAARTAAVQNEVCAGCPAYDRCGEPTRSRIDDAVRRALLQEKMEEADLPERLRVCCREKEALLASLRANRRVWLTERESQEKLRELRRLCVGAWTQAGRLLSETAEAAANAGTDDPYLAALAKDAFTLSGVSVREVSAERTKEGIRLIQALCPLLPDALPIPAVLDALYERTGIRFASPAVISARGQGTILRLAEAGALTVHAVKRVRAATGEEIPGDAVSRFYDGRGKYYCVLSDGMGTGKTAALNAVMTASLFARLVKAGLSPEGAIGAVNTALLTKETEETLSTLDVVEIDLFTGQARFLKAGAAASAVRQGSKTQVIEKASLPLGILPDASFAVTEAVFSPGDLILMYSDGADRVRPMRLRTLLDAALTPESLADAMLGAAVEASPIGRRDDVTVVALEIRKTRDAQTEKKTGSVD